MNIQVLDCTLRDGGYCNNWEFGINNIKYIVDKLIKANIDIIEIGFLSDEKKESENNTIFRKIDKVKAVLPAEKKHIKFVCMCNYGEIDFTKLETKKDTGIDGIRLAYHKKDWRDALEVGKMIQQKGYELFLQPMVTMMYTDNELIEMIDVTNQLNPKAIYIVDSFGVVRKDDLYRMYYLMNHSLNEDIIIGYHSHNNMQLSFANSQCFVEIYDKRDKIIDSSVFGMGRGAGNLNTELFVEHLNNYHGKNYSLLPILQIIDNVLNRIYATNYWGYSLPHYLSSSYNCHPNYATYLSNKNTLNIEAINEVLSRIPVGERINFNKKLIEDIYVDYQSNDYDDSVDISMLSSDLQKQPVIILAPGTSLQQYHDKICHMIENLNAKVLSVNFLPKDIPTDMVFISNQKRFEQFESEFTRNNTMLIYTSNINLHKNEKSYCVNYKTIRNSTSNVEDNSMLMLLNLLLKINVRDIYIAGMDGYSESTSKNYFDVNMIMNSDKEYLESLNAGINTELGNIVRHVKLNWITPSVYLKETI